MTTKLSVYVRNENLTPSSYYRIIQYLDNIKANTNINSLAPTKMYGKNIILNKNKKIIYTLKSSFYYLCIVLRAAFFLIKDNIFLPDCVIISKHIIPKYMPIPIAWLLKRLVSKSRLIWDFDDFIFKENGIFSREEIILGDNSYKIVVTSEFLKEQLPLKWRNKVILLPTTDGDLQGFNEIKLINTRMKNFDTEIKLVWVGTKSSMIYLDKKIEILDKAAKVIKERINKKLILTIVCNDVINTETAYLEIRNVHWTRERAKLEIYESQIGIMPLDNTKFALGKGGFKLVQYMSTGLPVIASNVGYNKQVVKKNTGFLINEQESLLGWIEAIEKLSDSRDTWIKYSKNSFENWENNFSYNKNLNTWNSLINNNY